MKKKMILFLVITFLVNCMSGVFPAYAENDFTVISQSVQSGEENVGICPVLVYEFTNAISPSSLANISLNDDTSYIKSAVLDDNEKTLTIRLAKELSYYTYYTLDLSGVKDYSGNAFGRQITFRTKYGDNSTDKVWIKEDNFETGVYNSVKWRSRDTTPPAVVTIDKAGDAQNKALYLANEAGTTQRLQTQYYKDDGPILSIKDTAVVKFSVRIKEATAGYICEMTAGATCSALLNIGTSEFKLRDYGADGTLSSETFVSVGSWTTDGWTDFMFVVDVSGCTYKAYVNGTKMTVTENGVVRDYFTLKKDIFTTDTIEHVRFNTYGAKYYIDDISIYRQEEAFSLENASVKNGDTGVSITPELRFDFNHRISLSGFTPSINGDTSYIKSVAMSETDDTVMNIVLAKELDYDTEYTLNLSVLKDIYGSYYGENISFTTVSNKNIYNIVKDDFEANSAIDTEKWRVNGGKATGGVAEIVTDPVNSLNNVLHLMGTAQSNAQFDNYQKISAGMPGDVVIEFKLMIPKSMLEYTYRPYLALYGTNAEGTAGGISNTQLMRVYTTQDKTGYDIKFKDADGTYTSVASVDAESWIKLALCVNPVSGTYDVYVNDTHIDHCFELANKMYSDRIDQVRIQAYNGYEIYIDDLKIAQRLALVPANYTDYECFVDSDGNTITELDANRTVHRAKFVNNGPADEAMILFLALYDAKENKLADLKRHSFTVRANSHYDVELSYDNLGTKANSHFIKAIYVNNETEIKPHRAAAIPPSALLLLQNSGLAKVVPTYPDGKLKAVTFSIDDGNNLDKNFVSLMNKYNMKATFNIVGSRADGTDETMAPASVEASELAEVYDGHEIASHSYSHFSTILSDDEFVQDLLKNEAVLEKEGFAIKGYAYPNGKTGDTTTNYQKVLTDNGYVYARDTGYTGSFDIPSSEELLCVKMTRSISSTPLSDMTPFADDYIELMPKNMTLFAIWGHSHDISDTNTSKVWTWAEWETFCSYISSKKDIWYATNYDIYSYIAAVERLQVTADAISNPTDIDLWCTVNGQTVCIKSGESYSLQ